MWKKYIVIGIAILVATLVIIIKVKNKTNTINNNSNSNIINNNSNMVENKILNNSTNVVSSNSIIDNTITNEQNTIIENNNTNISKNINNINNKPNRKENSSNLQEITPPPTPGEIKPALIPHKMLIEKVEAYAMPSSTYVPNDSHVFVVTENKKICWKNYGRCWYSKGERVKVAENNAYIEWLEEFAPPENVNKCGITFAINGVCHTYANRELLIGEFEADVNKAAKDYVCVAIFGKYGYGLNQLKQLLRESFYKVRTEKLAFADDEVLETVLKRVDNYMEDELEAWKKVAEEYFEMPIEKIISEASVEDLEFEKKELEDLVNKREKIYQDFLDKKLSRNQFKKEIGTLLKTKLTKQLDYLEERELINREEKNIYSENISEFLKMLKLTLQRQEENFEKTGIINENLDF